jgi:hypothetical protein
MKNSLSFRSWFYFRMGWSTYFAFIFAAINTLTVTYYLAIERYPLLTAIFPNFIQYVLIVISIGIPLLIIIGYVHYKRTIAFKSEADVMVESNPYQRRNVVNNTLNIELSLLNLELILKLTKKETLSEEDLKSVTELYEKYLKFNKERKFSDDNDLKYLRENITNS